MSGVAARVPASWVQVRPEWQAGVQTYNKLAEKKKRVEYGPAFRQRDISFPKGLGNGNMAAPMKNVSTKIGSHLGLERIISVVQVRVSQGY